MGIDLAAGSLLAVMGLGMTEMMIIAIIAVLLFGQKLPEVARQMGGAYRDFRKGLGDIQSQFDMSDSYNSSSSSSYSPKPSYDDYDDYEEASAPKFEPPPSEPVAEKSNDVPSGDVPKNISEK